MAAAAAANNNISNNGNAHTPTHFHSTIDDHREYIDQDGDIVAGSAAFTSYTTASSIQAPDKANTCRFSADGHHIFWSSANTITKTTTNSNEKICSTGERAKRALKYSLKQRRVSAAVTSVRTSDAIENFNACRFAPRGSASVEISNRITHFHSLRSRYFVQAAVT